MPPLSPKLESLFVIIDDYVGLTHRELIDKIPPAWYSTNNPKKELTNALDRLKKAGRIIGKHDDGVYVYQSIKPTEPPKSEPMNTVGEFLDRTLADVARDFLVKESAESENVIVVTAEQEHVPDNTPPILPADIEEVRVYRIKGTDKVFQTIDEVMGYRAALNRKRFATKVADCSIASRVAGLADQSSDQSLGVLTIEAILDCIEICGGNLTIPEVAP